MRDDDPPGVTISPREIGLVLYRRRWWLVIPALFGMAMAAALALFSEPVYRSTATLLIDSQQIPTALVASPLTYVADERIAKIRQQITSRDNLAALVRKHRLYADKQSEMGFDDVLNILRGAVAVDLVAARPGQGGGGQGGTIAFSLSFRYFDPVVAQQVTEDITAMFLAEDKRIRTEQASGTAAFLGRRADELRRQLLGLEEERRVVEARYVGALPNQVALSAQSEAMLRAEIARTDAETQGLIQQNSALGARERELAQAVPPGADAHRRAEERLNQLTAVYSDSHPDVAAARGALAKHRVSLQREPPSSAGSEVVRSELEASRARIQMLAGRRAELVESVAAMDRRTAQAPQASYELARIAREYDNMKRQYEELREKQLEAQVASNLQAEDKGERFSIVDAPSFPFKPEGAGKPVLLAMGLAAGIGAGLVAIVVWEMLAGPVHGEAGLTRLLNAPPIAVIPVFREETGRRRWAAFPGRMAHRRQAS